MNFKRIRQHSRFFLLSGLVIFILAVILVLVIPGGLTALKRLAGTLLNGFANNYRVKIAYLCAAVTLAGTALLLLKRLLGGKSGTPVNPPPQNHGTLPKASKYRNLLLASLAVGVIFLYWAPFLFQGADIHVKIFDNLDSHIPHTKVLAESGKAFSLDPDTRLENFLDGIALSGVDSGYNVLTWLFMIIPPFAAYALNDLLIRLVALTGMVLLLGRHVAKPEKEQHYWIIYGAALCFALLPFYSGGGISIAGIPLLLTAFLDIKKQQGNLSDFLIILIFPFYSKLALAGFFITVSLAVLWGIDCWKKKRINLAYLGGLTLLTGGYVLTHFQLVYSFLDPDFTSFREEIRTVIWSTKESLSRTVHNFVFDRVNEVSAHHIFVMGAAALAVVIGGFKAFKKNSKDAQVFLMTWVVTAVLLTSILWGFKYWTGTVPLREKFQLLNTFDFSRFFWFNPFLWSLIFALALLVISRIRYGKALAAVLIAGQVLFVFVYYNWGYKPLLGIRSSFAGSPLTFSLSYREFYSESLFKEIADYIGKPKPDYRVVSLGIHPGISQYNGFYTLDIYTDVYSLEYKHRFRKIIERELAKSESLRKGFDENAKRCFLLSAELHTSKPIRGRAFSRGLTKADQRLKLRHLDLNTAALKALGGEYIFSAVEILNSCENHLELEKIFEHRESPWRIYLYRVV